MSRPQWMPSTPAAVAALALAAAAVGGARLPAMTGEAPVAAQSAPVVVELFTSQGCASCPPADRFVSQLAGGEPGQVIALAYHVDYWNQYGWNDPFSSHKWTERQARYGRALGLSDPYTPQLIINGRTECVANKRDEAVRKIAEARSAEPAGKVSLTAEEVAGGRGRKLHLRIGARVERPANPAKSLELWVAVTQSGLTTAVRGGENRSATLHDDFVVRQLKKAFSVPGKEGAERSAEMTIDVDPDWGEISQLAVVAFLQDPSTLAIQGAAAQALAAAR